MIKHIYVFIISFMMISCTNKVTVEDINDINLDNNDILIDTSSWDSLIDQTSDKEIDELIDILFDTSNY